MECRICNTTLKKFLDLGKQPIANKFLKADELLNERYYKLEMFFCPECYTVQIGNCPSKEDVFNDEYAFYSSTSEYMKRHFENLAVGIKESKMLPRNGFIVEIGSNDGTFLKNFRDYDHLGIEPSRNVCLAASENDMVCLNRFFNEETANWIIDMYGKADVIVTTNCFPHMIDRGSVLNGIRKLMKPSGIWINEEAYLQNIIGKCSYDQFYNEHIYFSSIASFKKVVKMYGMNLWNMRLIPVHGGSIRYYTTHGDIAPSHQFSMNDYEVKENLNLFCRFEQFAEDVKTRRHIFLDKMLELKGDVVGYGATAKSTTVLNYCKIGNSLISRIYDTTPIKQGKLSPGMHVPVVPYYEFERDNPKNVVMFAWNHMEEIMEKEKGKDINWILPI